MGAGQSRTRKLTVENDDPTSVIKVSDAVVQRLRNNQKVTTNVEETPIQQQQQQQVPVPQPQYTYEPSAPTLQLRQANVAQLRKNDQYWQERLKKLQESHSRIDEIIDKECQAAMEELKQQRKGPTNLPPCDETKKAVLACYKEHPNESMRCAKVVEAFQRCVDTQRQRVLTNRG